MNFQLLDYFLNVPYTAHSEVVMLKYDSKI